MMITLALIVHAGNGQEPADAERQKLKGEWIIVSVEARGFIAQVFGQVPDPSTFKTATFTDNQFRLKNAARPTLASYRLDPTTSPRSLDLTFTIGRQKATIPGIYELAGDKLTMCFDNFGESRPTTFLPPAKDPDGIRLVNTAAIVLRRMGADPKRDALDQNRAKCAANLLTLAMVMEMQVLAERRYPPAAIYSEDGKPLLSWRVALLAWMDQGELLKEFKTDEPWDSEHNRRLVAKMPKLYALPGVETKESGMTFFRVFTGKGTIYEGKEGIGFDEHLKGGHPHLMIVEAAEPVPWTKPDELAYDPEKPLPRLGRMSDDGFLATSTSSADRVQFIPKSTKEKKIRSMIQWRKSDEKP
jgi:uncharacterized protein (TIGR03067 family)